MHDRRNNMLSILIILAAWAIALALAWGVFSKYRHLL
jgi:DNA-binding transcriptional regulator of glucitol operon